MRARKNTGAEGDGSPVRAAPPAVALSGPSRLDTAAMTPAAVLSLQRTAGNAAAARAVQRSRHEHGAGCGHQDDESPAVQRSAVQSVLKSSGAPMAEPLRQEMEARLDADFSDVRLHTGAGARHSAGEIGARAYTSGSHVVIGDGGADKHTLAHELTHVIQQRQGPVAGTDTGNGLSVSSPDDRFERAAERNAQRVMSASLPSRRDTGEEHASATGSHAAAGAAPAVQRVAGNVDIKFRTKTLPAGTAVFKGGNWTDGDALIAAAKTFTTNGEWGACYLGTPANVSVGYMEQGNKLLRVTLKRDIKLLEIYGTTADDGGGGGDEKAAAVKDLRKYATNAFLMDSIRADGYDGAFMNADSEGSGKEVILHWAVVGEACEAAVASKQPRWNKMGYFEELSDDE